MHSRCLKPVLKITVLFFLTMTMIHFIEKLTPRNDCSGYFKTEENEVRDGSVTLQAEQISTEDETKIEYTSTTCNEISRITRGPGRNDARLLYRIYDYITVAEMSHANCEVCIATQGSVDKLFMLPVLTEHWKGPMSVAIFVPGIDWAIGVEYINFLQMCYPSIKNQITFHFVHSIETPPVQSLNFSVSELHNCDVDPQVVLKKMLKLRNKYSVKLTYPQNHLRNVARKTCLTPNVFVTDIDIIPSYGMYEELTHFLRSDKCENCVNVIPTFELDEKQKFPESKRELNGLVKKKLARQFHINSYPPSQNATNYDRWLTNTTAGPVHVAYYIQTEHNYEPYYVSTDKVPEHDERFIGFGFNRNTQVYEMVQLNYTFRVLSPIFTIHWDRYSKRYQSLSRYRQLHKNELLLNDFIEEVNLKVKNIFKYKTQNTL